MFNRFTTIFLGKDNCHYTTKEKQTGSATLDGKSQVQYFSKTPPKMPFFYHRRNLYLIGFLLAFIVALLEFMRGRHQNFMVFSGDLHSSQTIYPSAKMPYVPFSVADSGTKPAFIPV